MSLLDPMTLTRQCALAGVARSTVYSSHLVVGPNELELLLLALIDAEYTLHPFYGSRKMVVHMGKAVSSQPEAGSTADEDPGIGWYGTGPLIPASLTLSTRSIRTCSEA